MINNTATRGLPAEGRLLLAVVEKAVDDASYGAHCKEAREFLRTALCRHYLELCGVNYDYFERLMAQGTKWWRTIH